MTLHPRLAVSALCTYPLSFDQDVALWNSLGVKTVGLFFEKLNTFGYKNAIAALREKNMKVSCIVGGYFDLANPASWDKMRTNFNNCIEMAAEMGGCVYGAPGRAGIGEWDKQVQLFKDAFQPCIDRAKALGVRLGFEPTTRPLASFVSNLADSVDVMDKTGLDVIVDVGICWVERDIDAVIKQLGKRIALVQLSDYAYASGLAPSAGRILPGLGNIPLERFVRTAEDAGYTGVYEIELMGLEKDPAASMRKAVDHTNAVLNKVLGA